MSADGELRPVLYNNMFDGLYLLAKSEGRGALYRGLRAGCAATIPSTAVTVRKQGLSGACWRARLTSPPHLTIALTTRSTSFMSS